MYLVQQRLGFTSYAPILQGKRVGEEKCGVKAATSFFTCTPIILFLFNKFSFGNYIAVDSADCIHFPLWEGIFGKIDICPLLDKNFHSCILVHFKSFALQITTYMFIFIFSLLMFFCFKSINMI